MLGTDVRAILQSAVERGWSLIPIGEDKRPRISSWKPYQKRLPTREELVEWWQQEPPAWAVVTGAVSGVVILDFDGEEGLKLVEDLKLKPHVMTPRGAHLYVQHPGWKVGNVIGQSKSDLCSRFRCLDVRADGGYAILAGRNKLGWYQWVRDMEPDPLNSLPPDLRQVAGLLQPPPPVDNGVNRHTRVASDRLLGQAFDSVHAGRGRNEAGFMLALQLRDNGYSESEAAGVMQQFAAGVPPWNSRGDREAYTVGEAMHSLHEAYSRSPRSPWGFPIRNGNGNHPPNGNHQVEHRDEPGLPVIIVNNRDLRDIVSETLSALQQANNPPVLFTRSGRIVTVNRDERGRSSISEISEAAMRGRMARVADYRRTVADRDGGTRLIPVVPPLDVVRDLLALDSASWQFPSLEAVSESPFLRPDGSIMSNAGYDIVTRVYYSPSPNLNLPQIPDQPIRDELDSALAALDEAIGDFPFDSPASKANAIALLLTPIIRRAIQGQAPLALIDAPQPGVGKSLLAEVFAIIHNGLGAAMRPAPSCEEEWRKSLGAVLMSGHPLVIFDNLNSRLDSPSLALAITASTWSDRVLGESRVVSVSQEATWAVTGNNVQVSNDLGRRSYWIRLDARTSQPWTRIGFRHLDLKQWVKEHRGELVGALLTLARSWYSSGRPQPELTPLGSFESWSRAIAGILKNAEVEGFLVNADELQQQSDLSAIQWEAFLGAIHEWRSGEVFTVAEVIKQMEQDNDLRQVLPDEIYSEDRPGQLQRRLARALVQRKGRRYGPSGLHVSRAGLSRSKVVLWQVLAQE